MKKVLTIAGSDCSGGAGIQADIKTITVHKMYAMSAITVLTAQNTSGVLGINEVNAEFLGQQLDCIFSDIYPDSIKIGMVSGSSIIKVIVENLKKYDAKKIVLDPVMVSTSGSKLISDEALEVLIKELMPLATIITPNIPEAKALSGIKINNKEDMIRAAKIIEECYNGAILIKGGHLVNDATDLLYENGKVSWFKSERVLNPNTHGTGCTLSSAIACNLAAGYSLYESIKNSKKYLTGALKSMLDIGKGSGPLNHMYQL